MEPHAAFALAGATALLVAIPGPNVALIVANTVARGFRFGAATVLGTTLGVAVQLALVVLGLTALVGFAASAFTWLKWLGVVYLIWLGVRAWRQGAEALDARPAAATPARRLFWQGLLLATINPKTLLFNAAFLPQFVGPSAGVASLSAAAAIYLGMLLAGDMAWALSAHSAAPAIARLGRLRHRLTGGLLIGSGVGLALARTSR